ncbi:MAG: HAD-IIIA family hydrolase [Cytophagales bacterium]|nr:HAD-IIIA family hydrolase [Cytophagales bacterium]
MNKCVFLDRDGVINKDRPNYVYEPEQLVIHEGVKEAIIKLKNAGYMTIVITNQSGVDKGIYTERHVATIHQLISEHVGYMIDDFYYCITHRDFTNSLARKPGSLMFEKAIAKYDIDTDHSWMVGDRLRDLEPASSLNIRGILLHNEYGDMHQGMYAGNLSEAVDKYILTSI